MSPQAEKVRKALERLKRYGITITFGKNPLEGLRNKTSWDICEALASLLNASGVPTDVSDMIGRIYTGDVQEYLAEPDEPEEDAPAHLPPGDPPENDDGFPCFRDD